LDFPHRFSSLSRALVCDERDPTFETRKGLKTKSAESIKAIFGVREQTKGLEIVSEPAYLRFFRARFKKLQGSAKD
jgi:hypothetical protein